MTHSLSHRLIELEALEPEQTRQAVDLVKGQWWDPVKQDLLRRQVEINLAGEVMHPWLITELSHDRQAAIMTLPTLADVGGYDCRDMIRVEIVPNILEAYAIRHDLKTADTRIHPETDFYRLALHIRCIEAADRQP